MEEVLCGIDPSMACSIDTIHQKDKSLLKKIAAILDSGTDEAKAKLMAEIDYLAKQAEK